MKTVIIESKQSQKVALKPAWFLPGVAFTFTNDTSGGLRLTVDGRTVQIEQAGGGSEPGASG